MPGLKKMLVHRRGRFGLVRNAAGRWSSSSGSAPLNFDYGLRQFQPRNNHDTIFLITIPARARTPSPHVCLRRLPHGCEAPESPSPTTVETPAGQSALFFSSLLRRHCYSKRIASTFQNGFLQVAVSKTLRRRTFFHPRSAVTPECFRYSTKTFQAESVRGAIHLKSVIGWGLSPVILSDHFARVRTEPKPV